MRIVIATGIYPPEIGGPATYTKTIAEHLSRRGHTITVVTYGGGAVPSSTFRVVVVGRHIPKGVRHLCYFLEVLWYGMRADMIFAQDPVSAGLPACIAAIITRRRFVIRVAGDYAWEQGMGRFGVSDLLDDFLKKTYGVRVEFLRKVERMVTQRAKIVIVPSVYLRSVVERWGVAPDRVRVVYNAIEVLPASVPKAVVREELKLSGPVLLSAGRLVPWKGFALLIRLMPEILKTHPDARLYIAGTGPEEGRLRQEAVSQGVADTVIFLGGKQREDLGRYVRAADIFLLNTGYEGFSHQLLEVMMAGTPIITTESGGNREIVEDEVNALIAGYNDQMAWQHSVMRLLADTALQQKIAQGARDTGAQFSHNHMIQETLAALGL
ncbi:MAG: hypothetical protein A3C84_04870 [Candidatus Ryanbacteria bacterium RIFCSPHIGHO2_02_FULL_48_12]|uniref:Glycosyltransferase subfamily 4-like N-terminal domain-containing protein n=1 Tax=Candidatus Ryanbacteria bacterium RIFCSPHIGHO2_01_FULL_48_27 TaxID=1802115 RepID=A0A1G2G5F2_9BACT|nr:MAG: hypothetical protein A2756_00545 [Candidatus Ryanbacteria bacterium RIFCSPHIGHO2_01_FULL_48_27]OGZ48406.1 MAG: hypothetical protein A3C84_04870 [Candidatus Ryanbacteria bacterium RIFCSPHIGHO2_02_FULL_48_12]